MGRGLVSLNVGPTRSTLHHFINSRSFREAGELLEAIDAFQHGEKDQLWSWVEERNGGKPDSLLHTQLRTGMPKIDDAEAGPMLSLARRWAKGHKKRLTAKFESSDERRAEVRRYSESLYKRGELRRALDESDDSLDEIQRAVFEVEKRLASGNTPTLGMVERRIKYDSRPSHRSVDSPRRSKEPDVAAHNAALWHTAASQEHKGISHLPRLAYLDSLPELADFFNDPDALAAYVSVDDKLLREWFAKLARQRLAPSELEVFELRLAGLSNKEIAARRGTKQSTVRGILHSAVQKLATAV